jgi:hypothetical protein
MWWGTLFTCLLFAASSLANEITLDQRTVGPWIHSRKSTYRYVTEYEVKKIRKPLWGYPWIEEDCHDTGNRFANWAQTITYEVSYGGGLNFSLLGFFEVDLGGERSRSIEYTFQRWVTPTEGIRARHRLMENYETWEGTTYLEIQTPHGTQRTDRTFPFFLDRLNYGISVEREILEVCTPKSS